MEVQLETAKNQSEILKQMRTGLKAPDFLPYTNWFRTVLVTGTGVECQMLYLECLADVLMIVIVFHL